MDDETQKIIVEQMKKLPKDVMEAIVSVDYKAKLQEITKRQRLMIDQAGKLEMETTLVMIGLEPLADFVDNIEREFGVNNIRAKEIAMDVSEHIFKPIRDSLQKMNKQLEEETPEEIPNPDNQNKIELNLNRDQILNEIENPIPNHAAFSQKPIVEIKATEIEIRPTQELETVPGQEVKNIIKTTSSSSNISTNTLENKMTGTTIIPQQIINAKPETKLPEIEKKKPTSGIDPYREALI